MTRDLHANFITQLTADPVYPRFIFEGQYYSSGTQYLRYWTGKGTLSWDSKSWLGDGTLVEIEAYRESESIAAEGMSVTLAGEPAALISLILQSLRQFMTGKLWMAFMSADNGLTVVSNPHQVFLGELDKAELEDDPSVAAIKLFYENKILNLDRPKEFRYNQETQHIWYPTDMGFEYIEQMAKWSQYWGKRKKPKKKKKGKDGD